MLLEKYLNISGHYFLWHISGTDENCQYNPSGRKTASCAIDLNF